MLPIALADSVGFDPERMVEQNHEDLVQTSDVMVVAIGSVPLYQQREEPGNAERWHLVLNANLLNKERST